MRLFVTATNTGVGKTYTTLQAMQIIRELGLLPGAIKPIETGVTEICEDGSKLLRKSQDLNQNLKNITIDDVVPYRFRLPAAPYVAKGTQTIHIDTILKKIEELERKCDILLIEGAGGVMVPIQKGYFMVDLIRDAQAHALLVTPSRLGSINDTLLSQEALERRGIGYDWYINLFEDRDSFFEITYPFYKDHFGEVPLDLRSILQRYANIDIA
ncbi:MAG: dethiobiotin synthase [Epsilonproteobacteria bacterium]|nr:dethiobiotin synthase [Campylobacterota bacterium]NPA64971.1 dethiobiotin synthase [Campylobacterota bacterium]